MVRWPLILVALACALAPSMARADAALPCAAAEGTQVSALAVFDGASIKLDTAEELVLVGVLPPRPPLGDEAQAWAPHEEAMSFLSALVVGRKLDVRKLGKARDRYQRLQGHVLVREGEGPGIWVQEALVRAGHARVFGLEDEGACTAALLAAEDEARTARRGLWSNAVYRVRAAEEVAALTALRGTFQIVEGRVTSVALRGARAYLNFGSDWTRDFTVVAGDDVFKAGGEGETREARSAQRKAKEAALKGFEGHRVRVRGWVRIRNGPMIEISHVEDVERVE